LEGRQPLQMVRSTSEIKNMDFYALRRQGFPLLRENYSCLCS
jgi:hypothetical protein